MLFTQIIWMIIAFIMSFAVIIFLGKQVADIEQRRKEKFYKFMEISVIGNLIEGLDLRVKKYPEEQGREIETIKKLLDNLKRDYKKAYGDYH